MVKLPSLPLFDLAFGCAVLPQLHIDAVLSRSPQESIRHFKEIAKNTLDACKSLEHQLSVRSDLESLSEILKKQHAWICLEAPAYNEYQWALAPDPEYEHEEFAQFWTEVQDRFVSEPPHKYLKLACSGVLILVRDLAGTCASAFAEFFLAVMAEDEISACRLSDNIIRESEILDARAQAMINERLSVFTVSSPIDNLNRATTAAFRALDIFRKALGSAQLAPSAAAAPVAATVQHSDGPPADEWESDYKMCTYTELAKLTGRKRTTLHESLTKGEFQGKPILRTKNKRSYFLRIWIEHIRK